ncbi:MAG: hypothetical protein Hyperionvirus2_27 [Hyperionvirus sp.]|uniref:Protein kinase domain-containing protein n=1 Tax=Hyperionvirus sp. TaxID=2487770 RepID=A0A3G5ABI2_9VIRU|nr:MAG: hypothetical protein Hyperionvirus2_27 [Hyperionvirus sp.]
MDNLEVEDKEVAKENRDQKYDLLEKIGEGSSCVVYKGLHKETKKQVAIKIIKCNAENDSVTDEAYQEILMMKRLKHPNIIQVIDSFVFDQEIWIVMELELCSCSNIIKTMFPLGIKDEVLLATILKFTLLAIEYCHSHEQIHRDIKAGNILIDKDGGIKLCDFGVGALLIHDGGMDKIRHSFVGTLNWMSPELMMEPENEIGYTSKIDIWAFGITCLEMGFGHAPYYECKTDKVMMNVVASPSPTAACYADQKNTFSKYYSDIVSKCLNKDPKGRPTAKELLEHKFFRQARDEKYIGEHIHIKKS